MSRKEDEQLQEWLEHVGEALQKDILPKMRNSAFVMSVVTPEDQMDPMLLIQVGAAVLLGKPLILISIKGAYLPPRARQVADEIVEVESMASREDREKLHAAMMRLTQKIAREETPQ